MQHPNTVIMAAAGFVVLGAAGCGTSEPTTAVSKIAAPDSPEFLKAREDANRTLQRQEQDESRLRKRRKLPQDE